MRLADTPPAYCSGCFQAKPDQRHVDFDVSWDGPVIQNDIIGEEGEVVQTIAVSIDDLVLCGHCLRTAAALVGLTDPGEMTEQVEQLQAAVQRVSEEKRGLQEYADRMEAAVSAKPKPPAAAKRRVAA